MKTRWFLSACLAILLAASRASAAPLYGVTDLGNGGVSLATDAGGHASRVTSLATGAAYAFDKAPVTRIDERVDRGSHANSYTVYTLRNGDYTIGHRFDYGGSLPYSGNYSPTFAPAITQWSSNDSPRGVVADVNAEGQAVGAGEVGWGGVSLSQSFAAFSDIGLKMHGFFAIDSDNLNNYIPPIPGVSLTNATRIDDLGRILAIGSDGDTYLLTPTALGPALPVPEPTMVMFFGAILAGLGARRAASRFGR